MQTGALCCDCYKISLRESDEEDGNGVGGKATLEVMVLEEIQRDDRGYKHWDPK